MISRTFFLLLLLVGVALAETHLIEGTGVTKSLVVKPGDTVAVTFPISEETVEVAIEKRKYTLVRRGNEIVDIYPRGQHYPYYLREHYRTGQPRWHKVNRYVSDRPISW